MIRIQIYLTEEEQRALRALSSRTGRSPRELIREAIATMLAKHQESDRVALLRQARGLWKDRADLLDFRALRRELDRVSVAEGAHGC